MTKKTEAEEAKKDQAAEPKSAEAKPVESKAVAAPGDKPWYFEPTYPVAEGVQLLRSFRANPTSLDNAINGLGVLGCGLTAYHTGNGPFGASPVPSDVRALTDQELCERLSAEIDPPEGSGYAAPAGISGSMLILLLELAYRAIRNSLGQ